MTKLQTINPYKIAHLQYFIGVVASLLSGCSSIQLEKYQPSPPPEAWVEPLPATQISDAKISNLINWWQQFNDPVLSEIISAAQAVNADIATAKANIIQAQAAIISNDADFSPKVTADASASRSQESLLFSPKSNVGVSLNASWELDVWGKNTAINHAQTSQFVGKKALWHEARVIVAAETAKQYVNYRLCENLSNVAQKNAASTAETARLSQLSASAGFLASANASQAEAQAAEAVNQLKKQQLQCVLLVKGLVALTAIPEGKLQATLDKNSASMPAPLGIIVETMPAKTLAQRPDIFNAEQNVTAASEQIVSTDKERYPRLTLNGNLGWAYDTNRNLFASARKSKVSDGFTWGIGPVEVSLPLFDAGVRRANVEVAKAQYNAAKSIYDSVVRNAVREVEESLARLNNMADRLQYVKKSAQGFSLVLEATQLRYQANLANMFELEEAKRASLQAEINTYSLENERTIAWIDLYRALGGGWKAEQHTLPKDDVSATQTEGHQASGFTLPDPNAPSQVEMHVVSEKNTRTNP